MNRAADKLIEKMEDTLPKENYSDCFNKIKEEGIIKINENKDLALKLLKEKFENKIFTEKFNIFTIFLTM